MSTEFIRIVERRFPSPASFTVSELSRSIYEQRMSASRLARSQNFWTLRFTIQYFPHPSLDLVRFSPPSSSFNSRTTQHCQPTQPKFAGVLVWQRFWRKLLYPHYRHSRQSASSAYHQRLTRLRLQSSSKRRPSFDRHSRSRCHSQDPRLLATSPSCLVYERRLARHHYTSRLPNHVRSWGKCKVEELSRAR